MTLLIIALFILVFMLNSKINFLTNDLENLKKKIRKMNNEEIVLKKEAHRDEAKENIKTPSIKNEHQRKFSNLLNKDKPLNKEVFEPKEKYVENKKEDTPQPQPKPQPQPQVIIDNTPTFIDKVINKIKTYFTTGNILVRVGGVIMLFGISFLFKYAIENTYVSLETKLIGVSILAVFFVIAGWKLRFKEGHYGIILQALGVSVAYLVIYVSAKYFSVLPEQLGFILMFSVVLLGSVLSIIQNQFPLALFSIVGGFAAPILMSDGTGNYMLLFTYYALLDIGIIFISIYHSWRVLNIVGALFTFGVMGFWISMNYNPSLFMSIEPFLLFFFTIYLSISVIFTFKQKTYSKGFVDSFITFGLPTIVFPLQVLLIDHIQYGVAYSSMIAGLIYGVLFFILSKYESTKLLSKIFLIISIVFFTITIPYMFDYNMTAVLWALESVGVVWLSLKQDRPFTRIIGLLLQLLSTISFIIGTGFISEGSPFINITVFQYLLIISSLFTVSYLLEKNKDKIFKFEIVLGNIIFSSAIVLFLTIGYFEIVKLNIMSGNFFLGYISLLSVILYSLYSKLKWRTPGSILQLFLPLSLISIFVLQNSTYLVNGYGLLFLVLMFSLNYFFLYKLNDIWKLTRLLHIGSFFALIYFITQEFDYLIFDISTLFNLSGQAIIPGIFALLLLETNYIPKAFKDYKDLYYTYSLRALILYLSLWFVYSIFTFSGLYIYVPIFNLLELTQIASLVIVFKWILRNNENGFFYPFILVSFIYSMIILGRIVSYFTDIPYDLTLLSNNTFQTGLTIYWSLLAISLMILSIKRENRKIWIAGFVLLSLSVVKLFLFEIAQTGTIERIVSFMAVGALLLIVGYFAPIPPKEKVEEIED